MKFQKYIAVFATAVLLLACGRTEIKKTEIKNAMFSSEGHNPEWNLTIDENNGIYFNSEFGTMVFPKSKRIDIMNMAGTSFSAKEEENEIRIEIFKKQCIDSQETKEFKYEVRVEVKLKNTADFKTLKGCGSFYPDKRLEGKWKLQKLNGVELNEKVFCRGIPYVKFDLEKLRISGNGGCNNFNGGIRFVTGNLFINKELISTRLMCNNQDFENKFFKQIAGHLFKVEINNGSLILSNRETRLEFVSDKEKAEVHENKN